MWLSVYFAHNYIDLIKNSVMKSWYVVHKPLVYMPYTWPRPCWCIEVYVHIHLGPMGLTLYPCKPPPQ